MPTQPLYQECISSEPGPWKLWLPRASRLCPNLGRGVSFMAWVYASDKNHNIFISYQMNWITTQEWIITTTSLLPNNAPLVRAEVRLAAPEAVVMRSTCWGSGRWVGGEKTWTLGRRMQIGIWTAFQEKQGNSGNWKPISRGWGWSAYLAVSGGRCPQWNSHSTFQSCEISGLRGESVLRIVSPK